VHADKAHADDAVVDDIPHVHVQVVAVVRPHPPPNAARRRLPRHVPAGRLEVRGGHVNVFKKARGEAEALGVAPGNARHAHLPEGGRVDNDAKGDGRVGAPITGDEPLITDRRDVVEGEDEADFGEHPVGVAGRNFGRQRRPGGGPKARRREPYGVLDVHELEHGDGRGAGGGKGRREAGGTSAKAGSSRQWDGANTRVHRLRGPATPPREAVRLYGKRCASAEVGGRSTDQQAVSLQGRQRQTRRRRDAGNAPLTAAAAASVALRWRRLQRARRLDVMMADHETDVTKLNGSGRTKTPFRRFARAAAAAARRRRRVEAGAAGRPCPPEQQRGTNTLWFCHAVLGGDSVALKGVREESTDPAASAGGSNSTSLQIKRRGGGDGATVVDAARVRAASLEFPGRYPVFTVDRRSTRARGSLCRGHGAACPARARLRAVVASGRDNSEDFQGIQLYMTLTA